MIAVSSRETPEAIASFRERFGVRYPVALDPTGEFRRLFNVQRTPTYFVLDPGRVTRFQGHLATPDQFLTELGTALGSGGGRPVVHR